MHPESTLCGCSAVDVETRSNEGISSYCTDLEVYFDTIFKPCLLSSHTLQIVYFVKRLQTDDRWHLKLTSCLLHVLSSRVH